MGIILMSCVFMSFDLNPSGFESEIPKHISRKLKRDAARLAIRMESQGEELSLQSIEIPQKKANTIYNLLAGIYDSGIGEASTVFDCNIRAATDIAIDKFWIIYEKDASWANSLSEGIYEADGDIGDLMDDYELFITEKKVWNESQNIITIESAKLYNMIALVQKFQGEEGIIDVVTNNSDMKPDSDIRVSFREESWNISFIKKWSSMGDTKSHSWTFKLNESGGDIKFVEAKGDEMPDWMRCQMIAVGSM